MRTSHFAGPTEVMSRIQRRCYSDVVLFPKRIFFSSRKHPDRIWNPPILLVNGYRGFLVQDNSTGAGDSLLTSIQCGG
jgi:hypothetical protein